MIKLKSLLLESIFDLEDYRTALYKYMDEEFPKEFDPRQQLMFGLTMDDLKKAMVDKVLNTRIIYNPYERDAAHGEYVGAINQIYIDYNDKKYDKNFSYKTYVDSILFHELTHALNFHKKLWDDVTYDALMLGKSYYTDPEETRAYRAEIRNYLVQHLGMSRKKAEALMNRYTSDPSIHRKEWIPKYYSMVKEISGDVPPPIIKHEPISQQKGIATPQKLKNAYVIVATLWGEARGEGVEGMQAVLNVIINRSKGNFDNAINIVLCPKQFSVWNNVKDPYEYSIQLAQKARTGNLPDRKQYRQALELVDEAMKGKLDDITNGAIFYFNPKIVNPSWARKLKFIKRIGNHDFYGIPKKSND